MLQPYMKFVVALLTAAATYFAVDNTGNVDPEVIAGAVSAIGAVLVYFVPNRPHGSPWRYPE